MCLSFRSSSVILPYIHFLLRLNRYAMLIINTLLSLDIHTTVQKVLLQSRFLSVAIWAAVLVVFVLYDIVFNLFLSRNAFLSRPVFWPISSLFPKGPCSLRPLKLEERWFNYDNCRSSSFIWSYMYTFFTWREFCKYRNFIELTHVHRLHQLYQFDIYLHSLTAI